MSVSLAYRFSPLLTSKTPAWRSRLLIAALMLGFSGLACRAAYVQVYNNDFFLHQGEVRFARTLELRASRGRILDRKGIILASSVPSWGIWASPDDVDGNPAKRQQLAQLLNMPLDELNQKLQDTKKSQVWLKRPVDEALAQAVQVAGLAGVYSRKEYRRHYPEGESVAHVVGVTNSDEDGLEGIEKAFDAQLSGQAGSRRVIKDRSGRVVEDVGERRPPQDGQDIELSIDSKVQFFAYQKLRDAVLENRAKGGSAVVLDARSGEVLALVNYPSYQPEQRDRLQHAAMRNRAVTDTFDPGSVMKPFTIGLALETGRVTPETVISTAPGSVVIGGTTLHDAHAHGDITVQQVIQFSSNVGTAKIAMRMPAQQMWETFSRAGFGQKPELNFPGVASGRLRAAKNWRPIEQATMSYGYGLPASLLQMARAYTVFANDGQLLAVTLTKNPPPAQGQPVFSAQTAAQLRHMLQLAAGPGGTGQKAQTEGYSVGGKSGTAYKQIGKGYGSDKDRLYRGWFIGMAPIDQPRIIVGVMIDEPSAGQHFGGDVAAPVFSAVVQQTLRMQGLAPDLSVKPRILAQASEESL